MIEYVLFVMVVGLPLLIARCIGAMGGEDQSDHLLMTIEDTEEDGHELY